MKFSSLLPVLEALAGMMERGGVGQIGKTIFALQMPDEVTEGVLLRNTLNPLKVDYELPGYRQQRLMLVTRSPSRPDALALAEAACRALYSEGAMVGGIRFNSIRPATEPMPYPSSVGSLIEVVVNLDVNYVIV